MANASQRQAYQQSVSENSPTFQRFAPKDVNLSPAEQTSLYMSLMRRRASA